MRPDGVAKRLFRIRLLLNTLGRLYFMVRDFAGGQVKGKVRYDQMPGSTSMLRAALLVAGMVLTRNEFYGYSL